MENTVIYCRVSTDEEIQMNALASQVKEAVAAADTDEWVLVDRYIDEGKNNGILQAGDFGSAGDGF